MADEKPVTEALVDLLRQRARHGLEKYGATLDRQDLTDGDWCQHALEEFLDGAGYLLALKRKVERPHYGEIRRVIDEMKERRGAAIKPEAAYKWARRIEFALAGQPYFDADRGERI